MENKTIAANKHFVKVPITGADAGTYQVNVREIDVNGAILQTHYIIVEKVCEGDIHLKWMSLEGYYKFGVLSRLGSIAVSQSDGLQVPDYFTSLLDADSRVNLAGKEGQEKRTYARQISNEALLYYLDLATSPKVYIKDGLNWIEVRVNWNPIVPLKKNFSRISVEFILPEMYIQNQ